MGYTKKLTNRLISKLQNAIWAQMILRNMDFFKASVGVVLVLAAILVAQPFNTQAAYASANHNDRTTEVKDSANAEWRKILSHTDTSTVVQDTRLSVSKVNGQTSIILNIDVIFLEAGEANRMIGQLVTGDDVFTIANNLRSATLSPVQIEICKQEDQNENGTCNVVADTVTVQAEWTGSGHLSKDRTVSEPSDNTKVVVRESTRDATATATIDGEDPGGLESADLSKIVTVTTTN